MGRLKSANADIIATRDFDLRQRVERLASLSDRNLAQMTRKLLREGVEILEKELGLPVMDKKTV